MSAYGMRISDWSSDVCSSDLIGGAAARPSQIGFAGRRHRVDRFGQRQDFLRMPVRQAGRGTTSQAIEHVPQPVERTQADRQSGVEGTSGSVSVDSAGRRLSKQTRTTNNTDDYDQT